MKCKLGNVMSIKHGFPFKGEYFSDNGKYIVLTPANFFEEGGFKYTPGKEKYYISSFPNEYVCKKDDLIVVMTQQAEGLLGSTAFVPENNKYLHNQRIGLINTIKDKLLPEYAYFLFRTKDVREQIRNTASGSKVKHTSPEKICDVIVDLPDIETQKAISNVLFSLEKKDNINHHICADLEGMAKLLYDYWFVKFDFPDENGKPYKSSGGKMVWNEDLKREIPEGWEVKPLGDVFSFVKGRIPDYLSNTSDEDYTSPYITIDVANNGLPQYCNPKSMVACNGEVIMVMDGAASGDVYLGNIGSLGSTFSMLPSKRDDISNALIYMLLKANMAIYKRANTGSTVPHANRSFIEKMKVCLPANASYMSKEFNLLFNKLILSRTENQQLASLRDFLLPMLMNGQVKVGGKGNLPPVAYPKDEVRGEYMVAAEPHKAYDAEGKGV